KPYQLLQGDLCKIPTLTSPQRSMLLDSARSLNEVFKPKKVIGGSSKETGNRPGDDFNRKAEWAEILEPHGWESQFERDGMTYWKRPGKDDKGTSATTNYGESDLLYVFSTNAEPFEAECAYSKFSAYAYLNHKGNYKAAAAQLFEEGYGELSSRMDSYQANENGLVYLKPTRDGKIPAPLTNFTARIINDVEEDDGTEAKHLFEIETQLKGRSKRITIPATEFQGMNWVTRELGAEAIIYAGQAKKDHSRVAIQTLSENVNRKRVFTHTGWRKVDGQWCYLHGDGAIGPDGPLSIGKVALEGSLSNFVLPDPPTSEEIIGLLKSYLKIFDVAPKRVMLPLVAATWRSILEDIDFSIHLVGPTGTGKSELAALAQQHFGAAFDSRNLPANWSSTDNALEAVAFLAKDALLTIDDFAPSGNQSDIAGWHKKADRLFRAQGNRVGRQRMRQDSTLRPERPPRGLILSTGEDVPRMQSVRARSLILEISPGELDWDVLTQCQADASGGVYAAVMAYVLKDIALTDLDQVKGFVRERFVETRKFYSQFGGHQRTPEIFANLDLAFSLFLQVVEETGVVDSSKNASYRRDLEKALGDLAAGQTEHQQDTEPTHRFLELLTAALASGRAHVANPSGDPPLNAEHWGWKTGRASGEEFMLGERAGLHWIPKGECIGWMEGDDLYLQPTSSYRVAQLIGNSTGGGLNVTPVTLHKRLKENGHLQSTESGHRLTIRKILGGARPRVLHLKATALIQQEVDQVGQRANS
ncbi:MAG TPA: DUF927 domain-containing protein, partial [Acidobacteriota bacterium]|nr:DUF927 domain-containing protein [Acidobacteriota bacterium]